MEKRSSELGDLIFPVSVGWLSRIVIFTLAVLTNAATWLALTCAGVWCVLTQNDVQTTLASTTMVMIVQNFDEIAYDAVSLYLLFMLDHAWHVGTGRGAVSFLLNRVST